jgi:predicted RNA binding protein YcfA (HicA-like mRNA interferase family)
MPKLPVVSGKELIKFLTGIGFQELRQVGSHVFLHHKDGRRVVVPIHGNKDIPQGTMLFILKSVEISREDFSNML